MKKKHLIYPKCATIASKTCIYYHQTSPLVFNLDFSSLLSYFFLLVPFLVSHADGTCMTVSGCRCKKCILLCGTAYNCTVFLSREKKLVSLLWQGMGKTKDLHLSVTSSFLSMVWLWSPSLHISVKTKSTINGSIVQHSLYLRTHSLTST